MIEGDGLGPLTPLETIVLTDSTSGSRVVIAPTRGGMVSRFDVAGRPVFYLDAATLTDRAKNVRGGSPVLFPSPGALADDVFITGQGRAARMRQHGFARQKEWSVVGTSHAEATLALHPDADTREQYPWEFALTLRYSLASATLKIEARVENLSDTPMPFALGFHPYFYLPNEDKSLARVPTGARHAYDNVAKQAVDVHGSLDLTAKEVDLHLLDHPGRTATLERRDDRIVITADSAFDRWVVWTLSGKDFVCLEPWTARANALNTGEDLRRLAPGESETLTHSISVDARR